MAYFIFTKSKEPSSIWSLLDSFKNLLEAAQAARGYRQTLAGPAAANVRTVEGESEDEATTALERKNANLT